MDLREDHHRSGEPGLVLTATGVPPFQQAVNYIANSGALQTTRHPDSMPRGQSRTMCRLIGGVGRAPGPQEALKWTSNPTGELIIANASWPTSTTVAKLWTGS